MKPGLPSPLSRQRGATLLTGLIFLVVLTMIGITAARMSGFSERMSGNLRDRSIAMQAAELALRDAERDIRNSGRISGLTGFVAKCTNGLCYNGIAGYAVNPPQSPPLNFVNPVWETQDIMTHALTSVAYGAFTGAANIAGLSAQPRYLIEGIRKTPPGGGTTYYYRITTRAQGINPNTVVWLQEVFRP